MRAIQCIAPEKLALVDAPRRGRPPGTTSEGNDDA